MAFLWRWKLATYFFHFHGVVLKWERKRKIVLCMLYFKTIFLNSISLLLFLILNFVCFQCVSGTNVYALKGEEYKIIFNLIRNDGKFVIPKNVRTRIRVDKNSKRVGLVDIKNYSCWWLFWFEWQGDFTVY